VDATGSEQGPMTGFGIRLVSINNIKNPDIQGNKNVFVL
jgi:hypothetical protein